MLNKDAILNELSFRTSRSSGSGGQHVNKVETRAEAIFNIKDSEGLTEVQKQRLQVKLGKRMNREGELVVSSSESRSQFKNKQLASDRLLQLLESALKQRPKRKPTTIPNSIREKRLKEKRINAEKKDRRGFKP
ncbi:MAG: hypothetical protein RL266_513 [Bacteroidota bacterium]|jgi:ribosome-associated protein